MLALRLVADPRLAPGSRYLAYVTARLDRAADTTVEEIVVADLETGEQRWASPGGRRSRRPRWSPAGDRLAFLTDGSGSQQLWLWTPGEPEARQLTGRSSLPDCGTEVVDLDWSPDGRQIAITRSAIERLDSPPANPPPPPADRPPQAAVLLRHGPFRLDGQAGLVTEALRVQVLSTDGQPLWDVPAGDGDAWFPRWSPDGTRLAFLRRDRGQHGPAAGPRLWLAPAPAPAGIRAPAIADTGRIGARPVDQASGPVVAFTWSPAGNEIAYLGPPAAGPAADVDCRLFRCAIDAPAADGWAVGSEVPGRPVADAAVADAAVVNAAVVSGGAVSGAVVSGGAVGGAAELVELAAGWDRSLGSTVKSDDARGAGAPALLWSAATGRIYFPVADGGRGLLGWADATGAGHGYLLQGDRACLDPSLDPNGRTIAFVSTDPVDPGNVHLIDVTGAGERRVTDANPWLSGRTLAATRRVVAHDDDGTPAEGWITALDDVGCGPRPLIVTVHGGPHYSVGWRFSFENQRLAALGYAVLAGNPRGSGGYGRRFAAAIRGGWGSADLADLDRLIDACAAAPGIDAGRVAITGTSYGGYLAMWAITQSTRFAAAISENGISNLLAAWGAETDGGTWLAAELGGPPWQRPAAYAACSPITAADRIRTPLLLIHAELDQNCPIAQSEQMFAALRFLGRDVEFLRLSGEGHLINLVGRPSRRLARAQAVDRWLDRHLRAARPAGRLIATQRKSMPARGTGHDD